MELQFGKKITYESYNGGKQTKKEISYSVPIMVVDKSQLLSEIIKAIDLITDKQTTNVILDIKADENYNLRMLVKEYLTDKKLDKN